MTIYMDVSVLTLATYVTGIQRATREIAVRLIKQTKYDVRLLHYNAAKDVYHLIDNEAFFQYYVRRKGIKEAMITKKEQPVSQIGQGAVFFDLDAAWMCKMKRSYLLPLLKKQGARIVAHIYDIISVTHPQYCLERGVYNFMDFLGAHLQYADRIITNADETKKQLEQLADRLEVSLPDTVVVPLGADFKEAAWVEEHQVPKQVAQAAQGAPYILMVGTVEPRKNHKLVLSAYDTALKKQGYHIIFAGYMGWNMEAFEAALKAHPDFGTGIFHFEALDDLAVSYLYQHARYLCFASYTEGFGLPIAESIKRGTPVLCVKQPVYCEVGGDFPVWFEQDNPEDLCWQVRRIDETQGAYEELKAKLKTFQAVDWEESFKRMTEALD